MTAIYSFQQTASDRVVYEYLKTLGNAFVKKDTVPVFLTDTDTSSGYTFNIDKSYYYTFGNTGVYVLQVSCVVQSSSVSGIITKKNIAYTEFPFTPSGTGTRLLVQYGEMDFNSSSLTVIKKTTLNSEIDYSALNYIPVQISFDASVGKEDYRYVKHSPVQTNICIFDI